MTEPEARTKPISEVWDAFETNLEHKLCELISEVEVFGYDRLGTHYAHFAKVTIEAHTMLRAVLLERCEKEWGIMIVGDCASMPPRTEMSVYVADEFISALSFMAWELKQRGNELQKR